MKKKGVINSVDLKWIIPKKKLISNIFNLGDIILVKRVKNSWNLKQYPESEWWNSSS